MDRKFETRVDGTIFEIRVRRAKGQGISEAFGPAAEILGNPSGMADDAIGNYAIWAFSNPEAFAAGVDALVAAGFVQA